MNDVLTAFLLTLLAGLSTGIGSVITLLAKSTGPRFMALTLGFSAGVMTYVSLTEILSKATAALSACHGAFFGNLYSVLSFFGGILLIALIGRFIPTFEQRLSYPSPKKASPRVGGRLLRTGVFSAFAIALHNFPEGMATFVSALRDPTLALPVVVAIAIHNVPEGIAVAAPVYLATKSKGKAFAVSFLSGLAEPVGALVCWLLLMPFMSDSLYGTVFAAAAGIMVYISVDEILPCAEENKKHSLTVLGFIGGMALMAASLILFT